MTALNFTCENTIGEYRCRFLRLVGVIVALATVFTDKLSE